MSNQGIVGHSMPVRLGNWIIFESIDSPAYVQHVMRCYDIKYKQCHGKYEGKLNTSYLVHADDFKFKKCSTMARGQAFVLRLGDIEPDASRRATLVFPTAIDSLGVDLGWFMQAGREYALKQDAWTYDVDEGEYYCCFNPKPEPYKAPIHRTPKFPVYDFTAPHAAGRYPKTETPA